MCAAYSPPTEDITQFNSSLFNQPEETLSQAEADLLYLSKTKNDTSTATLTTFNNQVTIKGDPTIGTIGTTGYLYCYKRLNLYDVNSPNTNFAQMYMIGGNSFIIAPNSIGDSVGIFIRNSGGNHVSRLSVADASTTITNTLLCNLGATILDGQLFNTRQIKSTTPSSISHQLFDNMTTGGVLTIGNTASSNTINGATTFSQQIFLNSTLTSYFRFSHASTTYAFPFSGPTIQGYYLKSTGTGTTVVSATPTTILTTSSISIGVWRIDFSVQNVVGAAGAGTITQAQSYISTTLNGAVATAVPFTGSILRTHVSEVYGNNDVQIITSSITYNQSTAGVLYLNIVRTFATGTYSFTGEISITRIA